MIVLKDFKTTTQSFKAGDEFYEDIENLEKWIARNFVGSVDASPPPIPTEVPAVTFA